MRASRYFLQARQKASAGAQPPFHCLRGKGSLARTPQSKQVTPIWSGGHNSFYDSKKSRHETKTLITSIEPLSFCVAKTEINHGEELSPAWRFSGLQQVRSKTSAVQLNRHSPKMAISREGHAGAYQHLIPTKCVCPPLWLDQTRQNSQVIFHPGLPEHRPLLGQIF